MDLILSHATAFLFWRVNTAPMASFARSKRRKGADALPELTDALKAELETLGIAPTSQRPLDLLVCDGRYRSRAEGLRTHVCAQELPAGSLVRLSPHILIASPELAFVQLGRTLPPARLALAGCELCGTYAKTPDLAQRAQLTTAADLRAFVAACPDYLANPVARRAASWVLDGAASPREAALALLLTMPNAMGGYGLPAPSLNAPLALSAAAYQVYPHSPCRADLFWESAALDVEYDGREAHEGRAADDIARAAALEVDGISVLRLTKNQVDDAEGFGGIAARIGALVGKPIRVRVEDFARRNAALRADLALEA